MAHEIAKLLLEHADSFADRSKAVAQAYELGMPLAEIEAYLDWLDMMRAQGLAHPDPPPPPDDEA